jgi:hypothetical protein
MFGKSRNGAGAAAARAKSQPAEPLSPPDAVEQARALAPDRVELRAWMVEHPLLLVAGGLAAGYVATSLYARGQDRPARSIAPSHAMGDPRAFERASSALWLIPLVELARIGLQAATYYMVATHPSARGSAVNDPS